MDFDLDLISKREQNKKDYENAKLSFADYLAYLGKSYETQYKSALMNAETEGALGSPSYGISGEKLRGMGLSNSGYKDYLLEKSQKNLESKKDSLYKDYLTGLNAAKGSYADYLLGYKEKQSGIAKSLISKLESDGVLDFDTAYKLALDEGLSEENAKAAAERGIMAARDSIYAKIIDLIGKYKYSRARAEIYAKEMGLSEQDVKSLGDYAYRMNEGIYGEGGLVEELENQHNNR